VTAMRERRSGWRRFIALAVAASLLGIGALCCQQALSIDGPIEVRQADGSLDAPTEGMAEEADVVVVDGGIDCGIPVPSDDAGCGSCVTQNCCPQMSACAEDKPCRLLEKCLLACVGDYACRSACVIAYPVGGQTDVPTLDTCVATSCSGACGMGCGQAGSYTTPPDAAPACETCMEDPTKNACAAARACATNLACEISGHCAYGCPTPDCRAACASDAGEDNLLFVAAFTAGEQCYAPCRIGRNWTCVNNVVWPQIDAGSQSQQATLTIVNPFIPNVIVPPPVSGVSAAACAPNDGPCASPASTGTSDDAGVVALGNLAPGLVFGFQGYFQMTAPSYVPNLYYLSFPLSQPNAQIAVSMMSQAVFASALAGVNITPIAGRGTVWAQVEDCLLLPAKDVVVKADGHPPSDVIYYENSNPSLTATSTDPSGWAFLYNVVPGPLTLRAISNDTGIESSKLTVNVRANAMSVVTLLPMELP
jgi:hypothetical protein